MKLKKGAVNKMRLNVNMNEIIGWLASIESDLSVPKNVRLKIKTAMDILKDEQEKNIDLKIDRSLQELSNVVDDPNVPQHTRMQIWNVVSQLENR